MSLSARVGLRKTSLVDYPGKVASVLFFPGCSLHCPWCHNPELVGPDSGAAADLAPLEDCLEEIGRRARLIGGVVFTGGEALLSPALPVAIARVHGLGLSAKLDTNGTLPERLAQLLRDPATRPDYVALDLKTGSAGYAKLGEGSDPFSPVVRSLELLRSADLAFELRSVVVPGFMDAQTLAQLAAFVPSGVPWRFSAFRPGNCLDPAWNSVSAPSEAEVEAFAAEARRLGKAASIR